MPDPINPDRLLVWHGHCSRLDFRAMRFPRVVRLDSSDSQVFQRAAEAGEWAVSGSFEFIERNPESMETKERRAFQTGWLGTQTFGRATLVEIAEIDEASFYQVVERLARHFVERHGAPDLVSALPAAREEADDAAGLCEQKLHSLLTLERELSDVGIVERFHVVHPERADEHAKIWQILPDEHDVQAD